MAGLSGAPGRRPNETPQVQSIQGRIHSELVTLLGPIKPDSIKSDLAKYATAVFAAITLSGSAYAEEIIPKTAPTLVAQTETNGKIYTVYVIQQDGSKKEVKYTKDASGIIIPPETTDGKLLDGSPATSNPKLNIGKNRSILSKYDKDVQKLANIDLQSIINEADSYIKSLISLAKEGKTITQDDLFNAFYGIYIFRRLGGDKNDVQLNGANTIAKVKMKMNDSDIAIIREKAEQKAKNILPVVTKAVG